MVKTWQMYWHEMSREYGRHVKYVIDAGNIIIICKDSKIKNIKNLQKGDKKQWILLERKFHSGIKRYSVWIDDEHKI